MKNKKTSQKTQATKTLPPSPGLGTGKPPFLSETGEMPGAETEAKVEDPAGAPGGTKFQDSDDAILIDDEIAGELANAPFTLINIFEPAWEVMNEAQMVKIGRALRIYLQKKGKTALDHPEILLAVAGYGYVSQQIKNVRKAYAERKAARNVTGDSRPEGDGKNVSRMVDGPEIKGGPDPDSGL